MRDQQLERTCAYILIQLRVILFMHIQYIKMSLIAALCWQIWSQKYEIELNVYK